MVINAEDILCYVIGESDVCCDCATDEEADAVEMASEYITASDGGIDERLCFCDRCGKRIWQLQV